MSNIAKHEINSYTVQSPGLPYFVCFKATGNSKQGRLPVITNFLSV